MIQPSAYLDENCITEHNVQIEGSAQDYANIFFSLTHSLFCSFENLMVKYTFCETIKIDVNAKSAFIYNLKNSLSAKQVKSFVQD